MLVCAKLYPLEEEMVCKRIFLGLIVLKQEKKLPNRSIKKAFKILSYRILWSKKLSG